jgi:hypothetical protein
MTQKQAQILDNALTKWMKKEVINTSDVQAKNTDLPISPRTFANIRKTARTDNGQRYQASKIEKLCIFLGLEYERKMSTITIFEPKAQDNG